MPRVLSESEYNAIRDRVLASLPSHLSEEAYTRMVPSALAGAIAEAENGAPAVEGSAGGRFAEGAWNNLNPIAAIEGLYGAVRHPIDTTKNVATSQLAQLSKALDDLKAGRYVEAAGHGAAGVLPILGPRAANAGERMATGDIAGGLGEGAGLLTPFAADAAITRGPAAMGAAARAVLPSETATRIGNRLEASAANRLATELGPKTGPGKVKLTNKLADVAPDLLRDKELGAMTREGFATKVAGKLDQATAVMDDAADSRLASQQVRTGPILSALDDQIGRLTATPAEASRPIPSVTNGAPTARPLGVPVEPAPNAAQIATLRKIRSEVEQLGPVAPYESVRRIRQAWDAVANSRYLSSTAEDAVKSQGKATGAMKGTGALREGLAATDPASAAAYRQYSLYRSADDVLTAAQEAERARPTVGRQMMRTVGGAAAGAAASGNVGAVVGAVAGYVVDRAASYAPTLQITIARRMQGIADALRKGQPEQARTLALSLKADLPPEFAPVDAPVAPPPSRSMTDGERRLEELQRTLGGRGR